MQDIEDRVELLRHHSNTKPLEEAAQKVVKWCVANVVSWKQLSDNFQTVIISFFQFEKYAPGEIDAEDALVKLPPAIHPSIPQLSRLVNLNAPTTGYEPEVEAIPLPEELDKDLAAAARK